MKNRPLTAPKNNTFNNKLPLSATNESNLYFNRIIIGVKQKPYSGFEKNTGFKEENMDNYRDYDFEGSGEVENV